MTNTNKEETEPTISDRIVGIIWRSILVSSAYTLTTFGLGTVMTKYGIPFPDMTKLGMSRSWFLVASIIMGFVIGAISQIVHTSKANHIMTWTILLFLNPFSVALESAVIAPQLLPAASIPSLMLVQFIAALITAILITFLFASSSEQVFGTYIHRPWSAWTMRFSICVGLALLLCSFLGATNYHLITKLYHDNYQIALALPTAEVVFAIQFMKALLIVLSLIPMIVTIGATKRFIAVMSGITLVVLGSLSPFLQLSNLSMFLFLASSAKIYLQNFLIGILAGFILGCPSKLENEGISMIEYLRPRLRQGLTNTDQFFTRPFQLIHPAELEKNETSYEASKDDTTKESSASEAANKLPVPGESTANEPSETPEENQQPLPTMAESPQNTNETQQA